MIGKKIGVDVDGVLADFNGPYMRLVVEVTGRNLFQETPGVLEDGQPRVWLYPEALGYTGEELSKVWQQIMGDAGFWRGLSPLYPADALVRALAGLRDRGHDVYFVTSRPGWRAKWQTEEWLAAHAFEGATVLICSDKAAACAILGLDAYIDDKLGNVNACVAARQFGVKTQVYLLDRPWNQDGVPGNDAAQAAPGVIRIEDPFDMLTAEGFGQDGGV